LIKDCTSDAAEKFQPRAAGEKANAVGHFSCGQEKMRTKNYHTP
jgi:hypothetical protein